MSIPVSCPACKAKATAPDASLGKSVRCPKCGCAFLVRQQGAISEPPPRRVSAPEPEPVEELPEPSPRRRRRDYDDYDDDGDPGGVNVTVNVNTGSNFPHAMHAVFTAFTCGAWAPIWFLHYLFRQR